MKKKSIISVLVASALALTGVGLTSNAQAATTTLTIWHNLGTTQNADAVKALTAAYQKEIGRAHV